MFLFYCEIIIKISAKIRFFCQLAMTSPFFETNTNKKTLNKAIQGQKIFCKTLETIFFIPK